MEGKKQIIETYRTEQEAINALNQMEQNGYRPEELSIISRYEGEIGAAAEEMDAAAEKRPMPQNVKEGEVLEQAGLLSLGGTAGLPGSGAPISAGPIAASLTNDLFENDHDRLVNALVEMGVTEEEARNHENEIREGKYLILAEIRKSESDSSD